MKAGVFGATGLVLAVSLLAFAQPESSPTKEGAKAVAIVVPDGTTPFEVQKGALVRIEAIGHAGATSRATVVEGGAKLVRKASVQQLMEGKIPPGSGATEYEFELTKSGQVEIELIEKFAGGDEGAVKTYRFTVK